MRHLLLVTSLSLRSPGPSQPQPQWVLSPVEAVPSDRGRLANSARVRAGMRPPSLCQRR